MSGNPSPRKTSDAQPQPHEFDQDSDKSSDPEVLSPETEGHEDEAQLNPDSRATSGSTETPLSRQKQKQKEREKVPSDEGLDRDEFMEALARRALREDRLRKHFATCLKGNAAGKRALAAALTVDFCGGQAWLRTEVGVPDKYLFSVQEATRVLRAQKGCEVGAEGDFAESVVKEAAACAHCIPAKPEDLPPELEPPARQSLAERRAITPPLLQDPAGMSGEWAPATDRESCLHPQGGKVEGPTTDIPGRLDRLPWSNWHAMVVFSLGITWILDGLEVTIVGSLGPTLEKQETLGLSRWDIGMSGTAYIAGAIVGALVFGWLTDRHGRKRLFLITMAIYVAGAVLCGFAWGKISFWAFRFVTGAAIGGEYSAINSAVDELIPARLRGRIDLAINGSYWLGAAGGALVSLVLLNPQWVPVWLGWRICFLGGGILSVCIILVRRFIPESPRWLMTHGRERLAEEVMTAIEVSVSKSIGQRQLEPPTYRVAVQQIPPIGFVTVAKVLFGQYQRQTLVGLSLMLSQAFFYNAIFFSYSLVLETFYHIDPSKVGLYIFPFALGNFLGPLLLGPWFDALGRRCMISMTYALSGLFILITGALFMADVLTAATQTLLWSVTFFVASPAASAAYLTVSEIFPLELRAMAIAFFYAVGTAAGGLLAPLLFGALMETTDPRPNVVWGYVFGALLMLGAAVVEGVWGVDAEKKTLEQIAPPLGSEHLRQPGEVEMTHPAHPAGLLAV